MRCLLHGHLQSARLWSGRLQGTVSYAYGGYCESRLNSSNNMMNSRKRKLALLKIMKPDDFINEKRRAGCRSILANLDTVSRYIFQAGTWNDEDERKLADYPTSDPWYKMAKSYSKVYGSQYRFTLHYYLTNSKLKAKTMTVVNICIDLSLS